MLGDPTQRSLLPAVAQWFSERQLNAPAIFFLELNRPLAFAASQCAIFFQPLLSFCIGDESLHRFAHWLSDEDGIAKLIAALQEDAHD